MENGWAYFFIIGIIVLGICAYIDSFHPTNHFTESDESNFE